MTPSGQGINNDQNNVDINLCSHYLQFMHKSDKLPIDLELLLMHIYAL